MRIAISGASGRMGKTLIEAVLQTPGFTLAAAFAPEGAKIIGTDAGAFLGQTTGITVSNNLSELENADCLIDFTLPDATEHHLKQCIKHNTSCVIGTTGLSEEQHKAISSASEHIPIVFAPNMSIGVNVTLKLLEAAAQLLEKGFDAEIFEAHHKHKVDAPSGTALAMGEVIAKAWGQELNDVADWARHGVTGPRKDGKIGFSVVRGGDIVGEHTAYFCGAGERIEITHRSSSRATYAQGSLRAAKFLANKTSGLYNMQDVLNA